MRLLTSIVTAALLLVVLSGCEGREGPKPSEAIRLTVITVGPGGDAVERGARGAAAMFNDQSEAGQAGVALTVTKASTAAEAAEALNQINSSRSAQGVAVNCTDASELQEAINNLVAAGIPVVTYLNDCPDSQRDTFVGMRPEVIGRNLGGALIDVIDGPRAAGQRRENTAVAIIVTNEPELQAIEAAAREYLLSFDEISLAPTARAEAGAEGIQNAIRSVKTQNANVTHWLIIAPAAVTAADAAPLAELPANRRGTVVYAGTQGTIDAVTSDLVDAVVARHGGEYGAAAVQILHGMIDGRQSFGRVFEMGPEVVVLGNLEAVRQRQQAIEQGRMVTPVYPTGARSGRTEEQAPVLEEAPAQEQAEMTGDEQE